VDVYTIGAVLEPSSAIVQGLVRPLLLLEEQRAAGLLRWPRTAGLAISVL